MINHQSKSEQEWALSIHGIEHVSPEDSRESCWDDAHEGYFRFNIAWIREIILEQGGKVSDFAMTHDDPRDYTVEQMEEWYEAHFEMVSELSACVSNAGIERFDGDVEVVCYAGKRGIRLHNITLPRDHSNVDRHFTPY